MAKLVLLEKPAEQVNDLGTNLPVSAARRRHRHDPSAHEFLRVARVSPPPELLGGQEWLRCTCHDHDLHAVRSGNAAEGKWGAMASLVGDGSTSRRWIYFSARAFSMAPITSGDSGTTPGSKRAITSPLRLTRNLAKFQEIGPANRGLVSSLVR